MREPSRNLDGTAAKRATNARDAHSVSASSQHPDDEGKSVASPSDSGISVTDCDTLKVVVPMELAGLRLDQALARLLSEHSRTRLRSWIDAGDVIVDDARWDARRRVVGGERVEIAASIEPAKTQSGPEAIALPIVFEDAWIVVIDKPAGLVVHPGSGNPGGTLLNALLHHDAGLAAIPRAGIVHRLDKDTSGLMVVAKTLEAHTSLVRQLASRSVTREYLAVAQGDISRAMIIDAPIGRHPIHRTTMAIVARGKPARTHVDVVERFGDATLVRCRLETGRTHQIRVHLAAAGHPLIGDPAYGSRRSTREHIFNRQALHAARLALAHPATGNAMEWNAPIPEDLARLIATLREGALRRKEGSATHS